MGKKKAIMKKMAMRKVLSCFVVFVILMSAMPVSVFAVNGNNVTGDVSGSLSEVDTHEDIVVSGVDDATNEAAYNLHDSNITGNTSNSPNETLLEKAFTEKSFANQRRGLKQQLFGCAYD